MVRISICDSSAFVCYVINRRTIQNSTGTGNQLNTHRLEAGEAVLMPLNCLVRSLTLFKVPLGVMISVVEHSISNM